jgi:hypothetical protein
LTPIGSTATGVVALLGEADGGKPGEVVTVDDPAVGLETFVSGPLADAIKVAFDPSADARIPGGAFRVLAYKTNNSTGSSLSIPSGAALAASTVAGGSTTTVVKWTGGGLPTGTTLAGFWLKQNLVGGSSEIRQIASVESNGIDINMLTPFSVTTSSNAIFILRNVFDLDSKGYGTPENHIHAAIDTLNVTIAKDDLEENYVASTDGIFHVMYKGGAIAASGAAYGTVSAENTTNSVIRVTVQGATSASAYDDMVLDMSSLSTASGCPVRRLIDSSSSDVASSQVFTIPDHTNDKIDYASNIPTLSKVRFTTSGTLPGGLVTGTFYWTIRQSATTSKLATSYANALANSFIDLTNVAGSGTHTVNVCLDSTQDGYEINLTLASGHYLTDDQVTALGGTDVYVRDITSATATVFGKAGVAKHFVTYVDGTEEFGYQFPTSPVQTLDLFKNVINGSYPYYVNAVEGVTSNAVTMASLDFGSYDYIDTAIDGKNTEVDIRFDDEIDEGFFHRMTSAAVSLLEDSALVTAARSTSEINIVADSGTTTTGSTTSVVEFASTPFSGTNSIIGHWATIGGDTVVVTSNTTSAATVFPALSSAPAAGISVSFYAYGNGNKWPGSFSDTYLSGGARGASTNSSFQAGFDALILQRHNHIIPLIEDDLANEGLGSTATWDSVAAQLVAHVTDARQNGRNECGGYIGLKGTKAELLAALASLNDFDVCLTGQPVEVLDSTGTLTRLPYWSAAVSAAGMRAGAPELGEPLTYKYVKTTSITQDPSWDPAKISDVNALLEKGLLFMEQTDQGFRWVRDMTTWAKDDNPAFMEGSVRDAVRYISYDFRKTLEDRFTGLKATPVSISDIRNFAATKLNKYNDDNIIVASLDENDVLVRRGWRKLRVFFSDGVVTVRVEIYPVQGITFQAIDITLQGVKLSA